MDPDGDAFLREWELGLRMTGHPAGTRRAEMIRRWKHPETEWRDAVSEITTPCAGCGAEFEGSFSAPDVLCPTCLGQTDDVRLENYNARGEE